jgi:putative phosphoribosyl transferase
MTRASELFLPFRDRMDAGRMLAAALYRYRRRPGAVVVALLRGGVVPAGEVAGALGLPLDVFISRKLGAPDGPEYAIGAIAEGGTPYLSQTALGLTRASAEYVAREVERQRAEIARGQRRYRDGRPLALPEGATVILIDDGIATGATAIAAINALRRRGVARIALAIPVAAPTTLTVLRPLLDDLLVLAAPDCFHTVEAFYEDFSPVSDDDVVSALGHAGTATVTGREQPKEGRHAPA